MEKLVNQLDLESSDEKISKKASSHSSLSEEKGTLIYLIDAYCKNLIDMDEHPVRKVRETFDEFVKQILTADPNSMDKILFQMRQFFTTYRRNEYTYVQKTFDEFRGIIFDFVDQLSEDLSQEQEEDREVEASLNDLKEAVEAQSIDQLRTQSRVFIDTFIEHQTLREKRRNRRSESVKRNLDRVQKQLKDANETMRLDHLTKAFNRRSFDEELGKQLLQFQDNNIPVSLISMDIDFFKKFNDSYGHAIGDFILIECVKLLKEEFNSDEQMVARVGGEEFCVILPGKTIDTAARLAEKTMQRIRKERWLEEGHELKFTMSMGIAQLMENETSDQWLKRADTALYNSKTGGRNKFTIASHIKAA